MGWHTTDQKFINPYNFVNLGGEVERADIAVAKREVTGCISCTLTTITPLAILDHESVTEKEVYKINPVTHIREIAGMHKTYDFFKVDGIPVIPGSEIRGAIRSAYETVTNSCMSVCNVSILSARHPSPRNPGILIYENHKWKLYEAKAYKLKQNNTVSGVIRKWYGLDNKPSTHIFVKGTPCSDFVNLDKAIEDYAVNTRIYCDGNNKFKRVAIELKEINGKEYPVWYESVGDGNDQRVYLSPACISRTVFDNRLEDLIGDHKKCTCRENLCPACSLFGMIGKTSLGSRLRFEDALPNREITENDFKQVTLAELAGPKTTSTEFYTKRPDGALTWNYDYKTTDYINNENINEKPKPVRQMEKITIRGRKFYFHSNAQNKNAEETIRNSTVSRLKEDISFSFKLYFDGISEKQLNQLVWLLCIGENDPHGIMRHKIGHGKPIGLGSVKIIVDEVWVRHITFINDLMTYEKIKILNVTAMMSPIPFSAGNDYFKEFMIMTNSETTKDKNVSYPIGDDGKGKAPNSTASHQWFIGNRASGDGATEMKNNVKYPLPELTEPLKLELPAFIKNNRPQTTDPAAREIPAATPVYIPEDKLITKKCKTCGGNFEYDQKKLDSARSLNPKMKIPDPTECPKCKNKGKNK